MLVGATGSGKTTIVNLLMRFYDIDSGEICINEQNIQTVARESLRQNIAIVLQDTVLFSDTVYSNLKYGNDMVSDEQLEAVKEYCINSDSREAAADKPETLVMDLKNRVRC